MIDNLVRNPKKVYEAIKQEGQTVIALKPMRIHLPKRFIQASLANFGDRVVILGKLAWIYDKYYAVSNLCAPMSTEPSRVSEVTIDGEVYMELSYEPGDRVIAYTELVRINDIMYNIYDVFIAKGKVPWYFNYDDLGMLFADAPYHAGMRVGANIGVMHIIYANIYRDVKDKRKYYRQTLKSREDLTTKPPAVIPLRAVSFGATNAIAKLLGSYFDENITSALVNPTERLEHIDQLLRA